MNKPKRIANRTIGRSAAAEDVHVETEGPVSRRLGFLRSRHYRPLAHLPQHPVNGCDLAAALVRQKLDLRVVFVSGYAGSLGFRYSGVPISHFAFVAKPVSVEDLLEKIRPKTEPEKEKIRAAGSAASAEV